MKIAIVLGIMGLGGHTRSAVAIGRALQHSGHDVRVFGIDRGGHSVVSRGGLPVISDMPQILSLFPCSASAKSFENFAREFKPDVLHCFDDRGLPIVYAYASRMRIPLVLTICGGPAPRYDIPDMCPIVAFSEELKAGLQLRSMIPFEHIFVNAARIELEKKEDDAFDIIKYRERLNIDDLPVILQISRIDNTKMNAMLHMIQAMDLFESIPPARLLILGTIDSQVAYRTIRAAAEVANTRLGGEFILMTEEGAEDASRLLPLATIAVGIGRTAYEAMHRGIPTLVVGEHGYAGVMSAFTSSRMAACNFSGRDALALPVEKRSPAATAAEIERILSDQTYADNIGREGKAWVAENLDSAQGARFYADLYGRPPSFFVPPKFSSIMRLSSQLFLRAFYNAVLPMTIKDAVVLVRKRLGGL